MRSDKTASVTQQHLCVDVLHGLSYAALERRKVDVIRARCRHLIHAEHVALHDLSKVVELVRVNGRRAHLAELRELLSVGAERLDGDVGGRAGAERCKELLVPLARVCFEVWQVGGDPRLLAKCSNEGRELNVTCVSGRRSARSYLRVSAQC